MRKETTIVIENENHARKFVRNVRNKYCTFYVGGQAFLPTKRNRMYDHTFCVEVTRRVFTDALVNALHSNYREPFTVQVRVHEENEFTFVTSTKTNRGPKGPLNRRNLMAEIFTTVDFMKAVAEALEAGDHQLLNEAGEWVDSVYLDTEERHAMEQLLWAAADSI